MSKNIKALFEDDYFVVFLKPAGLLVVPTPKKEERTLVSLVRKQMKTVLYPCHRLDKGTSGVIIFARTKKNQQMVMEEFKKQNVQKLYIAFVRGKLRQKGGEIRRPIADYHQKKHQKHLMLKPALTCYKVVAVKRKFSVVEVSPKTGRTNQIRIHFSEIGHPLLGERVYAFRKDFDIHFRRLALHAAELRFRHPVLKKTVKVYADLPEDMTAFLEKYK